MYVLFQTVLTPSQYHNTDKKTMDNTRVLLLYCPFRAL